MRLKTNKNMFNKENNFKIRELLILLFLLILLVDKVDFFKKVYLVNNQNYENRIVNIAYDYCSETGTGYLFNLKKKFKFQSIPKIINSGNIPNQKWIFPKLNKVDEKILVLISHDEDNFDLSKYEILDNYNNKCFLLKQND